MAGGYFPRILLTLAGVAGALLLVGFGWYIFRDRSNGQPPPVVLPWDVEDESPPRRRPDVPLDPRSMLFRECAAEVGITWRMRSLPNEQGETFKINLYDHGCGVAVGDYDGDGHDDLYFCNQFGRNALYHNRGDGTFEDVTEKAGVGVGDRVCVAATFVDYNNSGRQSLFVTSTRGGNILFKNMGDGTFKDVTREAGLTHVGHSQNAVFFDYDNDGRLDLFLANSAEWTSDHYDPASHHFAGKGELGSGSAEGSSVCFSRKEFNVLYHNNGDGTFTDVTEKAGLKGRGWAGDAVAFDYNGDGHMDLFVTCMFGRCQLYRNNGDSTFTDVTLDVLGRTPWGALGARTLDLKDDGRLSLYVVDMHSDMWTSADFEHRTLSLARRYEHTKFHYGGGPYAEQDPVLAAREKEMGEQIGFRHSEVLFGNACYQNEGGGKFTEVSDRAGLETFWPWGIATGDFDNDGYEDIFLPSGMGYPFYYWPNYLLMNNGNGTFSERADENGIEPPPGGYYLPEKVAGHRAAKSSRCAVTADFNGDGRLEIVTNNFNGQPYYFLNQAPPRNWVKFRLHGTRSNPDAIGAVVRLYRKDQVLTRQVQASCGYLSQSSKTLHFGLGDQADIDHVEITWPSGIRQQLSAVAANTCHEITEPDRNSSR